MSLKQFFPPVIETSVQIDVLKVMGLRVNVFFKLNFWQKTIHQIFLFRCFFSLFTSKTLVSLPSHPPQVFQPNNVFIEALKSGAISWTFSFSFDDGYWIAFHTIFQHICENVFGVMFSRLKSHVSPLWNHFWCKVTQICCDTSNYAWHWRDWTFHSIVFKTKIFLLVFYFQIFPNNQMRKVKWLSREPASLFRRKFNLCQRGKQCCWCYRCTSR